ncbi:MAG: hypothetical protein IPK67_07295 [Planctomycetes bacterium]|nr:hypothetical protein [Planctomycetota bacterium]
MSGSGSNAFLDLLRVLAPQGVPELVLLVAAALLAVIAAGTIAFLAAWLGAWLERRLAPDGSGVQDSGGAESGGRPLGRVFAWAGAFGALAACPIAPNVFFADLRHGAVAMLALLGLSTVGEALQRPDGRGARALAASGAAGLALLAALLAAGTPNLIAASLTQSAGIGLAWSAFTDPFVLLSFAVFVAARAGEPRDDASGSFSAARVRRFAWAVLGACYFLGGFESPLTWTLRQSLGEAPGFLNHGVGADGREFTQVSLGGFLFQMACAATLFAKALLLEAAAARLGAQSRRAASPWSTRLPWPGMIALATLALAGAGAWEWFAAVTGAR